MHYRHAHSPKHGLSVNSTHGVNGGDGGYATMMSKYYEVNNLSFDDFDFFTSGRGILWLDFLTHQQRAKI